MQLHDVIARRRMVRRFDPQRPVPPAAVREALAHAVRAPSAGFTQGWDFVVLADPADRDLFWTACAGAEGVSASASAAWLRGVRAAPVLVVCCSDPRAYLDRYAEPDKGWTDRDPARWPIPYWDVDTGMAAMLILLTAVDHGLGGLFFGVPADRHDTVRRSLDIPAGRRLVGVVALGHPLPGPGHRSPSPQPRRRDIDEVTHLGRFGRPGVGRRGPSGAS